MHGSDDTAEVVRHASPKRKSALCDSASSSSQQDVCQAFARGRCGQGNKCHLKHVTMNNASGDTGSRYQMHEPRHGGMVRLCYNFADSGRCRFGDRCHYDHNVDGKHSVHTGRDLTYQRRWAAGGGTHGQQPGASRDYRSPYHADRSRYSQVHVYQMDHRYDYLTRHMHAQSAYSRPVPALGMPQQSRKMVLPITAPVCSHFPVRDRMYEAAPGSKHDMMVATLEVRAVLHLT